ncbi:hypothetical protein AB0J52_03960 [Spirillospora sp. NPDC049652]
MSKDIADLSELPVESIDVLPADGIEQLDIGYGMTEISSSCRTAAEIPPCGSCLAPSDGEHDES